MEDSAGPPGNRNAGRVGARTGVIGKQVQVGNWPDPSTGARGNSNLYDPWLEEVELRASEGKAGRSERAVASAIARLIAPGTSLFVPVPALARVAGLSPEGARLAIGRLVRMDLLDFEAGNGRGIASVMVPLQPRGCRHGY